MNDNEPSRQPVPSANAQSDFRIAPPHPGFRTLWVGPDSRRGSPPDAAADADRIVLTEAAALRALACEDYPLVVAGSAFGPSRTEALAVACASLGPPRAFPQFVLLRETERPPLRGWQLTTLSVALGVRSAAADRLPAIAAALISAEPPGHAPARRIFLDEWVLHRLVVNELNSPKWCAAIVEEYRKSSQALLTQLNTAVRSGSVSRARCHAEELMALSAALGDIGTSQLATRIWSNAADASLPRAVPLAVESGIRSIQLFFRASAAKRFA